MHYQPHQLIDGARQHAKHWVAGNLGMPAHPHMAPTELVLETGVDALGGVAVFEQTTPQAALNADEGLDPPYLDHGDNLLVLLAQRSQRLLQAGKRSS